MFKIPEWGDDVPKNNINLRKVVSKQKTKVKEKKPVDTSKLQGTLKTRFKAKNKTMAKVKTFKKQNNAAKLHNINRIKQIKVKNDQNTDNVSSDHNHVVKENAKAVISNLDIQNYDSDNLDELIVNAKKNKLNATYQNEDNEESLFSECTNKGNINVKIAKKSKTKPPLKSNKIDKKKLNAKKKTVVAKHQPKEPEESPVTEEQPDNNHNIKIETKVETNLTQELNKDPANHSNKVNKEEFKKYLLKKLLLNQSNREQITLNGNKLRDRMMERLNAAKFRYLNEKLYTSSGSEAQKLFQSDPEAFQMYHQGYQQQVKKWPINPLDVIVKIIQNMPSSYVVADMGCGEAALARRVRQAVRSFDLVAAPGVQACDMAHTPLARAAADAAVYCLALMGTDLTQYLLEANRILKTGGHLLIAEVESRFSDVDSFIRDVQKLGFTLKKLDKTHKVFFFMHFIKARDSPVKKAKLPTLTLKPCIYKRR